MPNLNLKPGGKLDIVFSVNLERRWGDKKTYTKTSNAFQAVWGNHEKIKFGDLNQDNQITEQDLSILASLLNQERTATNIEKQAGDLNNNQQIDFSDWLILSALIDREIRQEDLPILLGDVNKDKKVNQDDIAELEKLIANPDLIQDAVTFFQADLNFDEDLTKEDLEILGEMVGVPEVKAIIESSLPPVDDTEPSLMLLFPEEVITLDASASEPQGHIVNYTWEIVYSSSRHEPGTINGQKKVSGDAGVMKVTYQAPVFNTKREVIKLTITDDQGQTDETQLEIRVDMISRDEVPVWKKTSSGTFAAQKGGYVKSCGLSTSEYCLYYAYYGGCPNPSTLADIADVGCFGFKPGTILDFNNTHPAYKADKSSLTLACGKLLEPGGPGQIPNNCQGGPKSAWCELLDSELHCRLDPKASKPSWLVGYPTKQNQQPEAKITLMSTGATPPVNMKLIAGDIIKYDAHLSSDPDPDFDLLVYDWEISEPHPDFGKIVTLLDDRGETMIYQAPTEVAENTKVKIKLTASDGLLTGDTHVDLIVIPTNRLILEFYEDLSKPTKVNLMAISAGRTVLLDASINFPSFPMGTSYIWEIGRGAGEIERFGLSDNPAISEYRAPVDFTPPMSTVDIRLRAYPRPPISPYTVTRARILLQGESPTKSPTK